MKNRGTFLRRVLGLALVLAVLLPLAGNGMVLESSAVTQAQIDALKGDANGLAAQRKDIQNQIKALQSDKNEALAKRDLLEKQIYLVQQEINNINAQLTMYGELIQQKAGELAQAEADEAAQFDLFCRRMRSMEEQGEVSYWSILFSSSSFSEMLDNYMMIEEIIQYDNSVVEALQALQEKVAADKAELEEAKAGQEAAKKQQEAAQANLKTQENELDALIEEINDREDELEAKEKDLKVSAQKLDSEIKRLEREMAAQISQVKSESGFLWPLSSNRNILSSLYKNLHAFLIFLALIQPLCQPQAFRIYFFLNLQLFHCALKHAAQEFIHKLQHTGCLLRLFPRLTLSQNIAEPCYIPDAYLVHPPGGRFENFSFSFRIKLIVLPLPA